MRSNGFLAMALLLAGCSQSQPNQDENFSLLVPNAANPVRPPPPPAHSPEPSLAEPQGEIDPKSAEAAGQLVQHYGALIEQGRWTDSWKLWSSAAAARQFDRNWRNDSEIHLSVGKLGEPEGAAGSIYVTVPVSFYGKTKAGGSFRTAAEAIVRRVNDVPGSTGEQRRWHIERVDLKTAR